MNHKPYITVDSLHLPELSMYLQTRENQLEHWFEPERGVFIAESIKVLERALAAGYECLSVLAEEDQVKQLQEMMTKAPGRRLIDEDVPIYVASHEVLKDLIGYVMTKGVLAAMRRPVLPPIEDVIRDAKRIAIMENVVNPTNVGAIFRSAAALNMDAVLLTKGCADPLQRRASRVSMGTIFQIPWTYLDEDWPSGGMKILKENGFKTAALALEEDSVSMNDPRLGSEEKLAMILGTEGEGLMDETIASADYTVMIPMSHGVDSLNVAAASAVAFWEITRGNV